jgi:asparagine synthase (glutamine-hydrolysing)
MIELCAFYSSSPDGRRFSLEEEVLRPHLKQRMTCRPGHALMLLQGDRPLRPFVFEGARVTVICRADLVKADLKASEVEVTFPALHIARMYEREGDQFVAGLRGTFAIILYDHKADVLKAWTDHFGTQKLSFTESGSVFGVATDLRMLLPILPQAPKLDSTAILKYLEYTCIPGPGTIYKEVFKLQAGHQLTSGSTPIAAPYWDMKYEEAPAAVREPVLASGLSCAVRSSVASNTCGLEDPSHLGSFLSGGTDSSSIAGLVRLLTGRQPRTFSIGFDDEGYNEIGFARIAASRYHTEHHEYFVKPDDILAILQTAATAYDEPFGNSSIVPTYYCARLAADNGVTHLLAGDGGDELFGGNARYSSDLLFQRYKIIPQWLRRQLIEPAVSAVRSRTRFKVVDLAARYIRRSNIAMPDRAFSYSLRSSIPAIELFTFDFLSESGGCDPLQLARDRFNAAPAHDELNRWLYMDLKITIAENDLRKVSTMSQLAGVTPRYPFLDPELAEFTGTIPSRLKVKGSRLRYLFKMAMADVLPREIIQKKKHGFGLPFSVWLGKQRSLREFIFDALGSARCRQRGYFRSDLLEWLWQQYESVHRRYYGELLWLFLMLELWHLEHYDSNHSAVREKAARQTAGESAG